MTPSARSVSRNPYAGILAAFAISRILYAWAGVRFQTHLILSNFQFIDVELMKQRLWESLFYYHTYPPLHNAIVGLIVKAFPDSYGGAIHVVHMALGAVSAVLLFRLMLFLAVPEKLACGLAILFIASPGCVLFENYPMYEYPIMALLLAQCVALYKLVDRPSFAAASLFFWCLAALALLRAFYHLFYVTAVVVALIYFLSKQWKVVAPAALLPLAMVIALYIKNLTVFGFFGASSWLGNNFPTITTHNLTAQECQALVRRGALDAFGCIEGASAPGVYRSWVRLSPDTGIPVLDQEIKSTGDVNYNHRIYLETGPRYMGAALEVFFNAPIAYARSVAIAWFTYFRPASDFFQFDENRAPIRWLDRAFNTILFGQFREATGTQLRTLQAEGARASLLLYTGIFLIVGLPAILIATAVCWVLDWRRGSQPHARQALLAFMTVQIVLVALIANFLSSYESNRYRFPTDPLYVALFGMLVGTRGKRG